MAARLFAGGHVCPVGAGLRPAGLRDPARPRGLPSGQLACPLRHCADAGQAVGSDGLDHRYPCTYHANLRCYLGLGRPRQALSQPLAVSTDGPVRGLPDRRCLQPVRVFRGAADRLLRADGAWRRVGAHPRRGAICGDQPAGIDAVPVRAGHDLCGDRHVEHGRSGGETDHVARRRRGADAGGLRVADAGLCHQGRAGAGAVLAAGHLCVRPRSRRGPVCRDDQGGGLCRVALRDAGVSDLNTSDGRVWWAICCCPPPWPR